MSFNLDNVVPWGRSYKEYIAMFGLTSGDLERRILGCSDGPASFNAELSKRGGEIVSVDPLYQYPVDDILKRINATYDEVLAQTRKNRSEFVWKQIRTVKDLGLVRMRAMSQFLSDLPFGAGRYVTGELPTLPFEDNAFGLALCSHFLFLYSEQLSAEFHIQAVKELCRVASEVRIFPLLELGSQRSRHIEAVIDSLETAGARWDITKVPYEFQKGGDEMLRITFPH